MTNEQRIKNLAVPSGKVDVVLDTDAYNEIDDQYAISYALAADKLNLLALYAAPFFNSLSTSPADGMERSYQEIGNLLTLAGKEVPAFRGSEDYLSDESTPVESEAARHLCALAKNYSPEKPLYVVAIGAITNVASALLMDPSIADSIVVVWLGGHALNWHDNKEFNIKQDVPAARVVFASGAPLVMLPCMGVVSAFTTSGPELDYWLRGKSDLCTYLAQHTADAANQYAAGRAWTRVIWDVTAVAWLTNEEDRFMLSSLIPTPIPQMDHHWSQDCRRPLCRYVYHINRDALMNELFQKLTSL